MSGHIVAENAGFRWSGTVWWAMLSICLWCGPTGVALANADEDDPSPRVVAKGEQPGNLRLVQVDDEDDPLTKSTSRRRRNPVTQKAGKGRRSSSSSSRGKSKPSATRGGRKNPPRSARKGEPVTSRLNLEAEDMNKLPEERTYVFSIVDGTYKELVENFGRMAGLPVLGEAPTGVVSFVSTQKMDFRSAKNRVNLLLFKYSPIEPYTLLYQDTHLEVVRVTDVWRIIPMDHIFMHLAAFESSQLEDNELAMLRYTPADTSVAEYQILRDFMPDYVRIAPMGETNSLAIFALVQDIKKYLELIRLFEGAVDDPRILDKLPVRHLPPSKAVETLRVLMDELDEAGKAKPRRRGGTDTAIDLPGQRTILFPDDAQGVIVIRAVPRQVAEVKKMLEFIDVDLGGELNPVLITIEHVPVDEIITIIRPLIAEGQTISTPDTRKASGRKSKKKSSRSSPTMVKTGDLVMIPVQRTNTLVVLGSDEEVGMVRRLVSLFDVPAGEEGPEFVEIHNSTPQEIAGILPKIINAYGDGGAKGSKFQAMAIPALNSVLLVGNEKDTERAKELIAMLDVPGDIPTLHSYKMLNGSPGTVLELITLLDSQTSFQSAPPKGKAGKSKARGSRGGSSGTHIDEAGKMVYILCTEDQWLRKYLPLIQRIDDQAAEPSAHARIVLTHLSPDDAISMLNPLITGRSKGAAAPKLVPAGKDIIVGNATPSEIAYIRAIVAEIDEESEDRQRRLFEIEYGDPAEIVTILQSGVIGGIGKGRPRAGKGKPAVEGIVISRIGRTLVVSALPEAMEEIAELIGELDIEATDDRIIRVYTVPPGIDVQDVASLLESLVKEGPPIKRKGGAGAADDPIRIVTQNISNRLLISAPAERFDEIEEMLTLLLEGEAPERIAFKFIPIEHADTGAIVSLIEPILQMREKELREMGGSAADSGSRKRKSPVKSSMVSVSSDVNGERILVTGIPSIIAEAEALIEQLDRPFSQGDRIMRVIELSRTTPDEIISAVGALLSGKTSSSTVSPPRPRVKKKGGDGKVLTRAAQGVTLVAAPGGASVIVSGYPRDVDEVERWIQQLDGGAKPSKVFKIYNIVQADLDQLAEAIMTMCDVPAPTSRIKKRGLDEGLDMFEPSGIRVGTDIILSVDFINRIIVARATPSKIYEIDYIVELYDGKEGEDPAIGGAGAVPFLIYELVNADAFDASIELDGLLEVLWPFPGDTPGVDYIPGTEKLVVKCFPEHNSFVKNLITEYVDKESIKKHAISRVFKTIEGLPPSKVAVMLKMRLPTLVVQLERIGEDLPKVEELKPYRPCVVPHSLLESISAVTVLAPVQVASDDSDPDASSVRPQEEELAEQIIGSLAAQAEGTGNRDGADETPAEQDSAGESPSDVTQEEALPVFIRFDDRAGVILIEGDPRQVDEVKDVLDDILEEIKSATAEYDIRVFRIRYRDVNAAANILETMFGPVRAAQPRVGAAAQQANLRRMQQQLRRQQQQLRQQGGAQQGAEPSVPIDPRTGLPIKQEEESAKRGVGDIRILPDPQNRALIVRAAPEDFPVIVELLATIDRPPGYTNEHRIFKLTKLLAVDVEEQLKVLLGITKTGRSRSSPSPRMSQRRRAGRGGRQNRAMQQIEEALLNMDLGGTMGEGAIDVSSDIVITSNERANTLLVMAPKAAIDMIAKLIDELESQDIPLLVTRSYELTHADATQVATQMQKMFSVRGVAGGKSSRRGFDPTTVNQVSFSADSRTNTLLVRALDADFDKIEPLIEQFDRDLGDQQIVITFQLKNVDATQAASTMNAAYGAGGRGQIGGKPVKFVGDAASNSIFVIAPEPLREEISQRIREMDELAGGLIKPRVIKVLLGSAEDIAKKLGDVFKGRSRKGDNIKITGDQGSKQIFVSAPDAVYAQIERLARSMDMPSTNIDVRTFPLQHAKAAEVHEKLMTMVRQASSQIRNKRAMDVFTAVPDERTNSIVVLGGPTSFALVKKALEQIDTAPTEQSQMVTAIYEVGSADAVELARNITAVYGRRTARGASGPKVEANRSNNSIIVRGPKGEVDEIYAQLIKPVVEQSAGTERVREMLTFRHVQAADIARVINDEQNKARGRQRRDGREPLAVVANESLNFVIISGAGDEVAEIVALAKSMDHEPDALKERITRVYDITYADANSLVNTIKNMFRQQRGQRPDEAVEVGYDSGTGKLVVTANPRNLEKIEGMLGEVDVETSNIRTERVITLRYASAQELGRNLQNMFRQNVRSQRGGAPPMNIFGDQGANSLIVYCNDDEFERIKAIVDTLDVNPEEARDRVIQSFTLTNTNPSVIADAIKQVYSPRGRQGNPRDEVVAIAEDATMSVMVSASRENMVKIEELITEFDKPGPSGSNIHVVELTHADAASVTQALQPLFAAGGRRGAGGPASVQISNPRGSSFIVVKAGEQKYQEVLEAIEALDSASAELGEVEVIALQHTDAEMMQEVLETYLRKPGQGSGGRGGTELVGDLRITSNVQNNTLVISGDAAEVTRLRETIAKLDVEIEGAGNAPRIIELKHARASQVEPVLTQMFVEGGRQRGGGRSGRGGASGSTMTPVIAADELANVLIVRASAADFGMIEDLIAKLDTETTEEESGYMLVPVPEGINVTDLAQLVEDTINQGERIRAEQYPNMTPGTVVINPDPRTNLLVVSGTPALFADVRRLSTSVANMGPSGRLSVRTLKLQNMTPEEVTRLLERVIQENTQSKSGSSKASSRKSSSGRRPTARKSTAREPSKRRPSPATRRRR